MARLTEQHITRYTIDGNPPNTRPRRRNPGLIVHIERYGQSDRWYITDASGLAHNRHTGWWDTDHDFRHATDKTPYLMDLDDAAHAVDDVIVRLRDEHNDT